MLSTTKAVEFTTFVPATRESITFRAYKQINSGLGVTFRATAINSAGDDIRISIIRDNKRYFGTVTVNEQFRSFTRTDYDSAEKAFAAIMNNRLFNPIEQFAR